MEENRFYILSARKLAGELSEQESRELDMIFLANPMYEGIYKTLLKNLPSLDNNHTIDENTLLSNLRTKLKLADPSFDAVADVPADFPETAIKNSFFSTNKYPFVFATAVLLLISGIYYRSIFSFFNTTAPKEKISQNNISTKPGSKSQVTLPDGSIVTLNADSKLTYPDNFLGDSREVILEGEAFFEVTKNKEKPFIIHSKAMDIKVLGTVFNVKAYPSETISEASLISGSIEVLLKNRTNERIMLKPNEKITVSDNTGTTTNETTAIKISKETHPLILIDQLKIDEADNQVNEIAWTQNKLIFNNQKLEDIAPLLERWYGVNIVIENQKLKGVSFTGRFYSESISQVLKALQMTHKFNYSNNNGHIVIY
jgi:ferric-dicitrate binding protein FerR (iron transport regulator)